MTFGAGENAGLGRDYTVYAKITGRVRFEHETKTKKRIRIIPVDAEPVTAEVSRVAAMPEGPVTSVN